MLLCVCGFFFFFFFFFFYSLTRSFDRRGKDAYLPEDGGNNGVHGKGARVQIVLIPDALTDGEAIVRLLDGVVDRDDDRQGPGKQGEDLVGDELAGRVRLALAKGVDCGMERNILAKPRVFSFDRDKSWALHLFQSVILEVCL